MQIHTHQLLTFVEFAHQGPPSSWNNVSTPSIRARNGHEERRPRSFMTSGRQKYRTRSHVKIAFQMPV
jgi:hypothetical protein